MLTTCFIILLFFSNNSFSQAATKQNEQKKLVTASQKMVAFTCDDVPHAGPNIPMDEIMAHNKKLLDTLKKNHVPTIGFVNEKLIFQFPVEAKQRIAMLQLWLDEGFELGNHTYSHWSMMDIPLKEYEQDVLRNEIASGTLMAQKGLKLRYFRHPYLITGPTLEYKNQFEKFLAAHGYTVAPITIEFRDHLYNLVYADAKQKNDTQTMERVANEYIDFARKNITYYEDYSQKLLGYQVKQILLFHDNVLNADYLQNIINLFKEKAYTFITVDHALTDKPYQLKNDYFGPNGESWLYQWAAPIQQIGEYDKLVKPIPSPYITNAYENLLKPHANSGYNNTL